MGFLTKSESLYGSFKCYVNVTPNTLVRINLGGFLQTKNAPPGNDETNFGIFYQAMRIPPYVHPPIYADGKIPRVLPKKILGHGQHNVDLKK